MLYEVITYINRADDSIIRCTEFVIGELLFLYLKSGIEFCQQGGFVCKREARIIIAFFGYGSGFEEECI